MDAGHVEGDGGPSVASEVPARYLAECAIFGLPVHRILTTRDSVEREVWEEVHAEAAEVVDTLLQNLARKIVKETADAQERGRK